LGLIILLTLIWALFLLASVVLSTLLLPVLTGAMATSILTVVRAVAGVVAFAAWVFAWQKLTELWLYRLLQRGGRS